jgi:hypothetical protein
LGFSIPLQHRMVPSSWATWSHGGPVPNDVYYSNGATAVTLTLPPGTGAFRFDLEPNADGPFTVTATGLTADGHTAILTESISGFGGASAFGFFATNGESITSIAINVAGSDFAIGEFAIAPAQAAAEVPEPATLTLFGVAGLALAGYGWRRRSKKVA